MTCILSFSVFNIAALMVSNVNNNNNNNNINDNQDNINDNNINESNTNANVMSMVMVGLGGRGLNVTKRSADVVNIFLVLREFLVLYIPKGVFRNQV